MAQSSPWFAAAYPALNTYLASGRTVADMVSIWRARRSEEVVPQTAEQLPASRPRFADEESVLEAYMGRRVRLARKVVEGGL